MNKGRRLNVRKLLAAVLVLGTILSLSGCRGGDDTIPTLPPKEKPKQVAGALVPDGGKWLIVKSDIVEDKTMLHYKDGQTYTDQPTSFFVAEHMIWESSCANTYYEIIKKREKQYDKEFFEDKIMVCAIQTASAGGEYQFEGALYAPYNGEMILTVYMSYDNTKLQNTLANYYNFLEIDKSEVGQIDKVKVETFLRAK